MNRHPTGAHNAQSNIDSDPQLPPVPLSGIILDDRGEIVAFTMHTPQGDFSYEKGNRDQFDFVHVTDLGKASALGFRPKTDGRYGNDQYFLCSNEAGFIAYLPHGNNKAFISVPGAARNATVDVRPEHVHPFTDVLFDGRSREWPATSVTLFESGTLPKRELIEDMTTKIFRDIPQTGENNYLHKMNIKLHELLEVNDKFMMDPAGSHINSRHELRRVLQIENRCVIAEEDLVRELRGEPLTADEASLVKSHRHYLLFRNMKSSEAQDLVRA